MNGEAKRYTITIFGQVYTIVSDQTEEHIKQSAAMVDMLMKEALQKAPEVDPKKIAVMVALQCASKCVEAEARLSAHQGHAHDLVQRLQQMLPS